MNPRALFCGSRDFAIRGPIRRVIEALALQRKGWEIVTGGASGADAIAAEYGHQYGLMVHVVPADWDKHGKAAGPIRNQRMLEELAPKVCYAFSSRRRATPGTADMCRRARAAGLPIFLWRPSREPPD